MRLCGGGGYLFAARMGNKGSIHTTAGSRASSPAKVRVGVVLKRVC